jgi:hypothetical protein
MSQSSSRSRRRILTPIALAVLTGALLGIAGAGPALAATDPTSVAEEDPSATATSDDTTAEQDPAAEQDTGGPVILIGTGGLRWSDVTDSTTALSAVLGGGGAGSVSVRGEDEVTCPAPGWLTVSTGRHSANSATNCGTPQVEVAEPGGAGTVASWAEYQRQAADGVTSATPGLLGDLLAKSGVASAAIGPGAAIALATSDGTAPHVWPGMEPANGGGVSIEADASTLSEQTQAALDTDPGVLVIDIGAVRDPTNETQPSHTDQVTELDNRLLQVFGVIPVESTVFVMSLADASDTPRLQLAAVYGNSGRPTSVGGTPTGASFNETMLTSSSTRWTGLVQARDLLPTLVTAAGLPVPVGMPGSTLRPVDVGGTGPDRLERLLALDRAVDAVGPMSGVFFGVYTVIVSAGVAGTIWSMAKVRSPLSRRKRVLRFWRRWSVYPAAVPAGIFLANLLPWWKAAAPGTALAAYAVAFALLLGLIAALGPWRTSTFGPLGVVTTVTATVLAVDVISGSHLVRLGLLGVQPLLGARFYGLGNQPFVIFGTSALIAAWVGAEILLRRGHRRWAIGLVAAVGLVAVLADGVPGWGSDFGGVIPLFAGFSILGVRVASIRLTLWRMVLILGAAVSVLTGLAMLDWSRPADSRTHLGRFVQSVLDGDAGTVVSRKIAANLDMLLSPWGVLGALVSVLVVVALLWPSRFRLPAVAEAYQRFWLFPAGLTAVGVLVLLGYLGNDSGVIIPVDAGMLILPWVTVAAVWAQQLRDEDDLAEAVRAARRASRSRSRK